MGSLDPGRQTADAIVGATDWRNMLCPERDTRLDVSARYLWVQRVQWFKGLMVQMRPRQPSRDRGQEGSKEAMNCQNRMKTKLRSKEDTCYSLYTQSHTV